jgi:hypothetical protein
MSLGAVIDGVVITAVALPTTCAVGAFLSTVRHPRLWMQRRDQQLNVTLSLVARGVQQHRMVVPGQVRREQACRGQCG